MNNKSFTATTFESYLKEHKLMGARCTECGAVYLPPRPLCPACYGEAMEWVKLGGKGKLTAFTAVHIGPSTMIDAGYDRQKPYIAGIVQLEEGPAISAQITGLDATQPEKISIGAPLHVTFIERGEGEARRTYLAFEAD